MIVNNTENKEIKQLKEELNKSKKIIEQLNGKIKELENRLKNENNKYINKIRELENNINQKNNELNLLRVGLQNINSNNQINNNIQNKDKCVTFISNDQGICFGIPCSGNSTFAEVEELLYRQYPEYRETNNTFASNGKEILRFKSISDNNIGTGKPIMLIKPS
jgi:seryl-tRNA synthetase